MTLGPRPGTARGMATSSSVLPLGRRAQSWFWRAAPPGAWAPHCQTVLPLQSSSATVLLVKMPPRGVVDLVELQEDVAALAVGEARVEDGAGVAGMRPVVDDVAVHVDDVGGVVRRAEADVGVVGARGIVDGDAGGIDARRTGGDGGREEACCGCELCGAMQQRQNERGGRTSAHAEDLPGFVRRGRPLILRRPLRRQACGGSRPTWGRNLPCGFRASRLRSTSARRRGPVRRRGACADRP